MSVDRARLFTELPEEEAQHILTFMHGEQRGSLCNAMGKMGRKAAYFQCFYCKRMMLYKNVEAPWDLVRKSGRRPLRQSRSHILPQSEHAVDVGMLGEEAMLPRRLRRATKA